MFLSKISAIQSQDPLKYTGYPKVHTFFRIYGVYFKESVLYRIQLEYRIYVILSVKFKMNQRINLYI